MTRTSMATVTPGTTFPVTTPRSQHLARLLQKQIQLAYWPGFIVGMYPSQFCYEPIRPSWDTIWRDVDEINLYFHIPFCKWSCRFCTFFKVVRTDEHLHAAYVEKLCEQLRFCAEKFVSPPLVKSICFGGGTPNAISSHHYRRVFDALEAGGWRFDDQLDPSMELSPEIITEDYIATVADAGITRVSFGVQSLEDDLRRSVNRRWGLDVVAVFEICRERGLNINCDLINGLKLEGNDTFMKTLRRLVTFEPETISVYLLSGSDSSLFTRSDRVMSTREKYSLYDEYSRFLAEHGYRCESHVKWVHRDSRSTHQQKLYEYQGIPTLGIGCGARSYNPVEHYSTPWHQDSISASNLVVEYVEKPFEEISWWGVRMNSDENRRRFVIYSFFVGDLDGRLYRQLFATSVLTDFPDEITALLVTDLITIDDGEHIRSTQAGIKYTDLIGALFWSGAVRAKFNPSSPEGQPEPLASMPGSALGINRQRRDLIPEVPQP